MKHCLNRGILVAIEGIDGVGKTTQSIRLVERLKALGFNAVRFFEPTNETPEAQQIRRTLEHSSRKKPSDLVDLFLADRRHDVKTHVMPALLEKKIVVMDRYFLSTAAYQSDSKPWQEILEMNREFAPEPDINFIINWPADIAMTLIEKRDNGLTTFENETALINVRGRYLEMAREDSGNYVVVEKIADEEDVCDEILDILLEYLHKNKLVQYDV
ncbi:MAG TPA: dTMP kinase [Candidatus Bathyarchaeia archaeon]|nr:dTMP kinase [Candidatus Bathyarchaeia archaeon]